MTERRAGSVSRGPTQLDIGPSSLRWTDGELIIDINERCAPFGQKLRGRVRARPRLVSDLDLALDPSGRHRWTPWAPLADVEVDLLAPGMSWQGRGYLDGNRGDEPLERAFSGWNWGRVQEGGMADVRYDLTGRDGRDRTLALRFGPDGHREIPPGDRYDLADSAWRIARPARWDSRPRLERTLEDTPFYTRSVLTVGGESGTVRGVHEALDLGRFRRAWVRSLLPFRMPREWRASTG